MQLLVGHDATVMAWARKHNPTFVTPKYAFGLLEKGVLRGAVMIVEETAHTADLGVVCEVTPGPGIARQVFRILFDYMAYSRVEITIRRSDTRSRKIAPKWGFKFDGTAHHYWGPGSHALRFVMLREDCPYLRHGNGQGKRSRSVQSQHASSAVDGAAAGAEHELCEPASSLQPA